MKILIAQFCGRLVVDEVDQIEVMMYDNLEENHVIDKALV